MKTLVFYNNDLDPKVEVEYITDQIHSTSEFFNVLEIRGLEEFEVVMGFSFQNLNYTLSSFKQFALDNNLNLKIVDDKDSIKLIEIVGGFPYTFPLTLS